MLQNLTRFQRLSVYGADGDVGSVSDLYLDDDWTVRYLIVSTGAWFGRQVVISPISADTPDWLRDRLTVRLTRKQVQDSPDVLARGPLSREAETQHAAYFGHPAYWGGPGLWGWAGHPGALAGPPPAEFRKTVLATGAGTDHLHLATDLRGLHIQVEDGEAGHVDDALVDDVDWRLRYLLADTSNWIGGRSVLLPVSAVSDAAWRARVLRVALPRERVRSAPEFDPATALDSLAEDALLRHYASPSPRPAAAAARGRADR